MKITVFGAGAIGSTMGAMLSVNHHVVLVGREPHMRAIRENGLRITGQVNMISWPDAVTEIEGMEPQDIILITVKAYDTPEALESITPIVNEKTIVVSLQNGLSSADLILSRYAGGVLGITSWGAFLESPGVVRVAGQGDTAFGSLNAPEKASIVARLFTEAGVPSRKSDNIIGEIWMKVIVNACINPITALLKITNGEIVKDEGVLKLVRDICAEGAAAARANGIALPGNPYERTLEVIGSTASNKSSMLQDIEHQRPTEIDQITGELVMKGEEKGVPMPVNRTLWRLIRGVHHAYSTAHPNHKITGLSKG